MKVTASVTHQFWGRFCCIFSSFSESLHSNAICSLTTTFTPTNHFCLAPPFSITSLHDKGGICAVSGLGSNNEETMCQLLVPFAFGNNFVDLKVTENRRE
jgi:hypothetical protein